MVTSEKPVGGIVVGIDGSDESKIALRWAADQAQRTDTQLVAVTAYEIPMNMSWRDTYAPDDIDYEGIARSQLDHTVKDVLGDDHPGLTVIKVVDKGHPAVVLPAIAARADLLVVGSRGHGAFAGMLLGSVSDHCVHHARCPVVVVRTNDRR